MKKFFASLAVILAALICLTGTTFFLGGCERERYEKEDEERVTATGKQMMEEWLQANMPEAELVDCSAYIDMVPSGPMYLTDYVCGTIMDNGEERDFAINTVSGAVYFRGREEELNETAEAFLYEKLGLKPVSEYKNFTCSVMAPANDGGSTTKTFQSSYDFGLPAGVEDIEAFVRSPQDRLPLQVNTYFDVTDDKDISALTLERLQHIGEQCGMYFASFYVTNANQEFSLIWNRETFLEEHAYVEKEGLRLRVKSRIRTEDTDRKTGEVITEDVRFDLDKDLKLEMTDNGMTYEFTDPEQNFTFQIYVDDDSPFRQYDYIATDSVDQEGMELTWAQRKDGSWALVTDQGNAYTFYDSGTLERKK